MKEEYELYTGKNNVETYIKKYNSGCFLSSESYINHTINLYNRINNKSKIEIDIAFYQQIYNIHHECPYFHLANYGIEQGLIYHPNQLNIILNFNYVYYKEKNSNKIYVKISDFYTPINLFVQKRINDITVNNELRMYHIMHNKISKSSDIFFLMYIGDYIIGIDIYKRVIKSSNYKPGNLGIVFKNMNIYQQFKKLYNFNNTFVIVLIKREYGNDIIPTLILFNSLKKYISDRYIIKVHTKNNPIWRNKCLNFLLNKNLKVLSSLLIDNVLTHPTYLHKTDIYNKKLILKNSFMINTKQKFAAGSILFTHCEVFTQILNYVKSNFRMFFFNVYYDNNLININNSPAHFLERLIGLISIKNKKYLNSEYENFDWEKYVNMYPDLSDNKINTKSLAWEHYINHGKQEGRYNCILNNT